MKIHDISQEVFTCEVFPGDDLPEKTVLQSIEAGDTVNLSAFSMCAHNGTHVDAPYHFFRDGKTVDWLNPEAVVGSCFVTFADGPVTAETAREILRRAKAADAEAAKRILIGGEAVVTAQAAAVFAEEKILLIGNESQSVGPMDAPEQVHYTLLGAGVVLLEGIRLNRVKEGVYLLNAAPLSLGGCDGAPCRAILIEP